MEPAQTKDGSLLGTVLPGRVFRARTEVLVNEYLKDGRANDRWTAVNCHHSS